MKTVAGKTITVFIASENQRQDYFTRFILPSHVIIFTVNGVAKTIDGDLVNQITTTF